MTASPPVQRRSGRSLVTLPDGTVRPEVLADPYALYAQLRAEAPVHFDPGVGGWLVSRYDDVRALALDERLLASRSRSFFRSLPAGERTRFELFARMREAMLLYLDGPPHARVRRAVAAAVHDAVAALVPARVEHHAEALVERIAATDGEVDLVAALAAPLPRLVLADLLGLPNDEAATMVRQSMAISAVMGGVIRADRVEQAEHALGELGPRLLALAAEAAPPGILAALRDAVEAGELGEDELVGSAVALSVAGHETTTNLIANAIIALADNPSAAEIVRRSEAGARSVVDEVLRFDAPVQIAARETAVDLDVGDVTIPAGERVVLLWGSANRDPERFEHPDRFEPGRPDHLATLSFGIGPHRCPGSGLARTEAELALRTLLRVCGSFRVAREPARRSSFTFRGPSALPAYLGAAA
jgi:cytochrome P450